MAKMPNHRRHRRTRRFLGLERKSEPVLGGAAFARRMAVNFGVATLLIALSLLGGMVGYRQFEKMTWIDAFANAAMILSGMGPFCELTSSSGKLFAGVYALYSGLVLILATGLILAPLVHRVLHHFHVDCENADEPAE